MAKAKASKADKKATKTYGPAVVLKPVMIGGFVLALLSAVLPAVLGGS